MGRAVEMVGELKGSQWRESAGKDQLGPGWLNKGLTVYPERDSEKLAEDDASCSVKR